MEFCWPVVKKKSADKKFGRRIHIEKEEKSKKDATPTRC
jgi:hypothetical protein